MIFKKDQSKMKRLPISDALFIRTRSEFADAGKLIADPPLLLPNSFVLVYGETCIVMQLGSFRAGDLFLNVSR